MFTDAPWSLPADGFNPFDLLDPDGPSFAADALVLAEMLTERTGNESGSSQYFSDAAQAAKRALIVHTKTTEPAQRQNLATLYQYVNSDVAGWEALLSAMKANPVCGGLVGQEANKLERTEAQAPEEFSAVMSTIQRNLNFLADPLVREKLSRSDVDFAVLKGPNAGQAGGVVSVVLPLKYIETHAAITRLAMACAILQLQRPPLAKATVLFLIDEAAALGKIMRFPNWLATLRKYRVSLWSIWQNVGQVADLYGKNVDTIISNCGLLQILGVGDLGTAELTEKLLGRHTVPTHSSNGRGQTSVSYTGRALLMADELLRLKDDRQIALIGNLHPVSLRKTPYWQRPDLAGRYHPNPYYDAATPAPSVGDRLSAAWSEFYCGLVWLVAPHPIAAALIWLPAIVAMTLLLIGG
ncbi:MAG: type IV secretory system conjugative DNA transfer family protein [Rhodospirillaceae bacterium]|nr:type IV secretory system conjugative DNA transfer family protein [Rhodospirillaceae bacterium]